MKKIALLLSLLFIVVNTLFSQTFTTNTTPVGLEHNILFNAEKRFKVTQTGDAYFGLANLFDGKFSPYYSSTAPTVSKPTIITIENIPGVHVQAGAWVGWSTRYWEAKRFKIEGYNTYAGENKWRIVSDYSNKDYPKDNRSHNAKLPGGGVYTKLRFTFYSARGTNGRMGLSELFFIHPEATTPYATLGLGKFDLKGNTPLLFEDYGGGFFMSDDVWIRTYGDKSFYHNKGIMRTDGEFQVGPSGNRLKVDTDGKSTFGNNVTIKGKEDEAEFLRFESDRPWSFINRGTSSDSRLQLKSNVSSKFFDIISDNGNKVASFFVSNTANRQIVSLVENGGRVGIGTNDPKNELSVNGTIWAKEVKVSLNDAADWVFEADYKLKTLAEVEAFIKRNKHLPEMPSADEFRANDIKVSEMTNKLLQKIEELTLYTIEQDKKLKEQEERLLKLERLLTKEK